MIASQTTMGIERKKERKKERERERKKERKKEGRKEGRKENKYLSMALHSFVGLCPPFQFLILIHSQ
jgi:hypothetical protein